MHEIGYYSYDENENKQEIWKDLDYIARREGGDGLYGDIRWINTSPLNSYDEAKKYIEDHESRWYDQLAVRYVEKHMGKPSKKWETLQNRLTIARDKENELKRKLHYENVKSEFVGCKCCGSKLSTKRLKSNQCPLCDNDLRPTSVLERIKSLHETTTKIQKELEQEVNALKSRDKGKVKWLVKVEWHS